MPCSYCHGKTGVCQFGHSTRLTTFDNKEYCIWHLPVAAKEQWTEEQNAEFHRELQQYLDQHEAGLLPADFTGVAFAADARFRGRTLKDATFSQATFWKGADFGLTTFSRYAYFEAATFLGETTFSGTHFNFGALFRSAIFSRNAYFQGAIFSKTAYFQAATFAQEAYFSSVTFGEEAGFEAAQFGEHAYFKATVFTKDADFESGNFVGNATFDSATFASRALFNHTHFARYVSFESVNFFGSAEFLAPEDRGKAVLRNSSWCRATFEDFAAFDNRIFTAAGNFDLAVFMKAPTFHGCSLHQAMVFPTEDCFKDTRTKEAAQAYRTLKLGMAAMKARWEEGMFFTLEQRSLRHRVTAGQLEKLTQPIARWVDRAIFRLVLGKAKEASFRLLLANGASTEESPPESRSTMHLHEVVLSWIYDVISEFGRNAVRPALCLILVWALFSVFYAAIRLQPGITRASIDIEVVKHAMLFSVEQIVRPFYVWGSNTKTLFDGDHVPHRVQLLASLQSILSLALLSLSLLAINWRFKRD